jgi:hypothetical protein
MTVSIAPPGPRLRYKFIELSLVTDETLEGAVNEWVARGWQLERIQFVTSEASRRPVMAFVAFVREEPEGAVRDPAGAPVHADEDAGGAGRREPDELADTAELIEP